MHIENRDIIDTKYMGHHSCNYRQNSPSTMLKEKT